MSKTKKRAAWGSRTPHVIPADLITLEEAARRLNRNPKTVANWASRRKFLKFYKFGGRVRVDPESVEAIMQPLPLTSINS